MGKEAFLRIQNKSTQDVTITIGKSDNVHGEGLEPLQDISLAANGGVFPEDATSFHRIEGEPKLRIQKDGYFVMTATTTTEDGGGAAQTRLSCDRSHWWSEGRQVCCQESEGVTLSVDIMAGDENNDGQEQIFVKVYDNIPSASWMEHLESYIVNQPLCQIQMPGTHDSCTYEWNKDMGASPDSPLTTAIQEKLDFLGKVGDFITDGVLDAVFERLCQCQGQTTLQQLEAGIRYLDLRVAYHPETDSFWSCHGVYCVPYTTILAEIKQFLTEHPKEVLLLDFNHFYGMSDENEDKHAVFGQLIQDTLGTDIMANGNDLKADSPLSDFYEAGAQAVCIYHHDDTRKESEGLFWHRYTLYSPWPNKNDTAELHDRLDEFVKKRKSNKFFVLQGILTPDGELIKEQILERREGISIKDMASRASAKVVDWAEEDWKDETQNVIIVDFFEDCGMVQSILNLNKRAPAE